MSIDEYRMYEFVTLVIPLIISLSIFFLMYVRMKRKYMDLRAYYEPEYRLDKGYQRYKKMNEIMQKFLFFEYPEEDE